MIELEELTIGHLYQYISGSMYRLMAVAECEETNKPTAVYQSVTSSKVWVGDLAWFLTCFTLCAHGVGLDYDFEKALKLHPDYVRLKQGDSDVKE